MLIIQRMEDHLNSFSTPFLLLENNKKKTKGEIDVFEFSHRKDEGCLTWFPI